MIKNLKKYPNNWRLRQFTIIKKEANVLGNDTLGLKALNLDPPH